MLLMQQVTVCSFSMVALFVLPQSVLSAFKHPGGWHTAEDVERIRKHVAAGDEPWKSASDKILAATPQKNYKARPFAFPKRGTENGGRSALENDAHRAYNAMLKWVVTSDKEWANVAVTIIDMWSATMTGIGGSDGKLLASIQGNIFVQAAELAAYAVPDWPNKPRAQEMFRKGFLPMIWDWRGFKNNWATSCMTALIGIAVFNDDDTAFQQAIDAYKNGFPGKDHLSGVTEYIDETGECAECGRDQAHAQLGVGQLLTTAITAWNQDIDLFNYANARIRDGIEYLAKYNLGYDVPYHPFVVGSNHTFVEGVSRIAYPNGPSPQMRGTWRPIYEGAYAYFSLAGLEAPYTYQVVFNASSGYEIPEGCPHFDHPGFGTLMFRGLGVTEAPNSLQA